MTRWIVSIVIATLVVLTGSARADYLEIRRDAWLKKTPTSDGERLERLAPSTLVTLASEPQRNGYYDVRTSAGQRGFVYRTLVRKHSGTPPPAPSVAGDSTADRGTPSPSDGAPPLVSGTMRAHLIDVGQGAATLFEFACGAVLIDTGGERNAFISSEARLRSYLDGFFARRRDLKRTLELVVLTHPHPDHTDNARMVGEEYGVKNVATNGLTTGLGFPKQKWLREHAPSGHLETVSAEAIPRDGRTSKIIDPLRCADQDPKLKVLWGSLSHRPAEWSNGEFENENNHSVVVRIDFGRASFLVTGDLELEGLSSLLAKHGGSTALDVDVWQVSHHGSDDATTRPLVDALTPVIALLATGREERHVSPMSAWAFGHPRKVVLDLLENAVLRKRPPVTVRIATGAKTFQNQTLDKAIYATGWDGSVVITADRNGAYDVETER